MGDLLNPRYMSDIATDPNWNKLRMSLGNFLREPSIAGLFLKNQWYGKVMIKLKVPLLA